MKKIISLCIALLMTVSCLSVSAFAVSPDDEGILLATKDVFVVVDENDNVVDIIDGSTPVTRDSSHDMFWEYHYSGTLNLYKSTSGYYVRLKLSTYNNYTFSRIVLKVRPNDTKKWTSLDKSYSDAPLSINERLDFTYTGTTADLSVDVRLQSTVATGFILDDWAYSGTITLDFN